MIEGPYVNNTESPYGARSERPIPYPRRVSSEADMVVQDPGSVGSQANELSAGIEELANQISCLRSKLDAVICPHPERAETMPCPPSSTLLGQQLAEANSNLRVQILRLAVITDNLGL